MPRRRRKVATGILGTPGPAGGEGRGKGGAVVQWRGGGVWPALPVVQGTLEVVAGLGGRGAGLHGRVTQGGRRREVLGFT